MMDITIEKSIAKGTIVAPPSKSMAHRLLICAGLSNGKSVIRNVVQSNDIIATLRCLKSIGADCSFNNGCVTVCGIDASDITIHSDFDCGESGSTLRFFIPIALMTGKKSRFLGTPKLISRPQSVYEDLCLKQGIRFERGNDCIITSGKLKGGIIKIPGNVSSQFVSGLLFVLPLLDNDSILQIVPPVESRPYIDLTIKSLTVYGIDVKWTDENTLYIKGSQKYFPIGYITVEGDYSNAAFFDALNEVGGNVIVNGLDENSLQGDKIYKKYYKELNEENPVLDISNCPDLGPVLFAVAAMKHGAVFTGTDRLRLKESDRIFAMSEELKKLGVFIIEEDNKVIVPSCEFKKPLQAISCHNDHRIAMAMSILLTVTGGTLMGAQCVSKSMPDFFEKLKFLGVGIDAK